jgi:hypothetical protein
VVLRCWITLRRRWISAWLKYCPRSDFTRHVHELFL